MTIYSSILAQHLALRSASMAVQRMSSQLVASALGKPARLAPSPVRKTRCFRGLMAASYLVTVLFMLSNQYSFNEAVCQQEVQ